MSEEIKLSSLSNLNGPIVYLEDFSKIKNKADLKQKVEEAGSSLICLCFFNDSEPCRKIALRYQELKTSFPEVVFYVGDVDQCLDVMQAFSLTMVPTFILIQDFEILEVFVGSSYFRLLRRIERRLLEDKPDDSRARDLERMSSIMHDDVYVLQSYARHPETKKSTKGVNVLGLHYRTSGPTWKDRNELFVEACEKVQQNADFMNFLYEPRYTEIAEASETDIALNRHMLRMKQQQKERDMKARRISFGEHFDLGPLKKMFSKESVMSPKKHSSPVSRRTDASSPLLKNSDRPLPSMSESVGKKVSALSMTMYDDLRDTIIDHELPPAEADEEVDEERCAVDPELFGLEDRDYSKEEVEALIYRCMRVCWLAKQNEELPLHEPMPDTIDFGDDLDIISSSDDSSD